jgi:hypothetical protein
MPMVVGDKYRINIFLDTNILADILDGTFENLNHSIKFFSSSDFISLKSSHYVMYELVEVRKREHFLREVVRNRLQENISISKLVGRKGIWKFDNVKYEDHKDEIQNKILAEKERIANEFRIDWDHNVLHDKLLSPTLDLCLASTISREDSLVLLSCAYPNESEKESQIIFLTRDKLLNDSYNEAELEAIFDKHGLNIPEIIKTGNVACKEKYENIPQEISHYNIAHTQDEIQKFWIQKIKEIIIDKNKNSFLGYTYVHNGNQYVFFNLQKRSSLNENIGLTIIGKDLDFVYSTHIIPEFWNNQKIDNYPFVDNENNAPISFKPYDKDENGSIIEFQNQVLLAKMREKGNLVFINEDA